MRRSYRTTIDVFPTRVRILSTGLVFFMVLVTIRLFVASVVASPETRARAEEQYLVRQTIEPNRGKIYATDLSATFEHPNEPDKSWVPVATNARTYALSVVPRNLKDPRAAAEALAKWANRSVDELAKEFDSAALYLPPLRHGLTEAEKNQLTALKIRGLFLLEEQQRYYPENELGAQILGFLNAENIGNYGVEQKYNDDLKGSGGQVVAERDVRGRLLSSLAERPVQNGTNLVLTIDRNVQGYVEKTLKKALETYQAASGTVVVMDAKTGGIVAMASEPSFNPNIYRDVPKNEQSRFLNPATAAVWEPGSIFKTVVMAAAIDNGVVEPETEGVFSNSVQVGKYEIHTAENKAFGRETMTQVLEHSDNVAMVWVAQQLGTEKMAASIKKFGFGAPTGIDLPGEVGGNVLPASQWHDIERSTMSFGQGIATTPLQIVSAMAALGNGGHLLQPHIVQQLIAPDGSATTIPPKVVDETVISATTSAKITAMMVSVVVNGHGKRAAVPGYAIAGKTGTAQIPNPAGGYYEDRHIGGFAGFFPADNPRFAMVVKLDEPKTVKFAESSAAPTFGEIAKFMLNYYRIPPTVPIAGN